MRVSLQDFYKSNYEVQYLNLIRQYWEKTKCFSCLNTPKKHELLVHLCGCDAVYELLDGRKIYAKSGNIVYAATGSQYKVTFTNFKSESSGTFGINFLLFDEKRQPVSLNKDIIIFNANEEIINALERAEACSQSNVRNTNARFKAVLLQVLSVLGENSQYLALNSEQGYASVSRAISYINTNLDSNLSVTDLAKMCKISEVYLRKLFHKFTGFSPNDYRTHVRLKQAEKYLTYGDMPVGEIAELLGFSSTAYFIKLFKRTYGCSPLSYRKQQDEH